MSCNSVAHAGAISFPLLSPFFVLLWSSKFGWKLWNDDIGLIRSSFCWPADSFWVPTMCLALWDIPGTGQIWKELKRSKGHAPKHLQRLLRWWDPNFCLFLIILHLVRVSWVVRKKNRPKHLQEHEKFVNCLAGYRSSGFCPVLARADFGSRQRGRLGPFWEKALSQCGSCFGVTLVRILAGFPEPQEMSNLGWGAEKVLEMLVQSLCRS